METQYITPDVKQFRVTKPEGYQFVPGEATDITLLKPEWKQKRNAFTFTSLNEWPFLEFTIKIYQKHQGVTNQLQQLTIGDEFIIHDSFGNIHYEQPGTFIAGGSGVTPFIAILRQLYKEGKLNENQLLLSNKTVADIILKEEFESMLGTHFINTLTKEDISGFDASRINKPYLQNKIINFSQYFYICGRRTMMQSIATALLELGVSKERIITEMNFETQDLFAG